MSPSSHPSIHPPIDIHTRIPLPLPHLSIHPLTYTFKKTKKNTGVDAGAVIPATILAFFVDRFFLGGQVFDQFARVLFPKYKVRFTNGSGWCRGDGIVLRACCCVVDRPSVG